jgi:hypothetical protein
MAEVRKDLKGIAGKARAQILKDYVAWPLICGRYELPYNTGPFHQQLGMVQRSILRLAFPGGQQRPKPGPYYGPRVRGRARRTPHPSARVPPQAASEESVVPRRG